MIRNKTLANWLIGLLGGAFIVGIFETEMTTATAENFYLILGLGLIIVGIFIVIRLYKLPTPTDKENENTKN